MPTHSSKKDTLISIYTSVSNPIFIVLGYSLLFIFFSCTNKNKSSLIGAQPSIDSTFIISYIQAEPRFKGQLDLAKKFYKERKFQLGWFKNNTLVPQAHQMLEVINKSADDALNPKDYLIKNFDQLFADLEIAKKDTNLYRNLQKDIDVALSATYFLWASDYYRGRVIPNENKQVKWDVKRNKIKLNKALATVLQDRKSKYPYANFQPLHTEYLNLKKALVDYRKIKAEGGWSIIPMKTRLKPGETSLAVSALRKRVLNQTAVTDSTKKNIYDDELVAGVKLFQSRQGLKPTGYVGQETLSQLNIPVDERISTIILNMERWRWIPKSLEPDYLLVNIPEYRLHVFEKGQEQMTMKVIVGKTLNSTPIFSDKLEYVVLSPYWNVPMSILKSELVPKLIKNPNYLDKLEMEVVTSKGQQIDPSTINWGSINESNFKYIVRRRPGPKNDLGDVKFIFPNSKNIYLHDTPNDALFSQTERGFSHGCVRVEKPIDLAVYLLRNVKGYDQSKILKIISERKEKYVTLKQKLPVYLVYFTAWADANGIVNFRDDLYGHDKTLAAEYFN